jgi:hypothetical protein
MVKGRRTFLLPSCYSHSSILCPQIPGRRYPVDIYFTKAPEADYIDAAVQVTRTGLCLMDGVRAL